MAGRPPCEQKPERTARLPRAWARCERVFSPRWTLAKPLSGVGIRRPATRLWRDALTKSCLLPDPPNEKKAKSQPFASILHTVGERLVASDPKICFQRSILDRRRQSRGRAKHS